MDDLFIAPIVMAKKDIAIKLSLDEEPNLCDDSLVRLNRIGDDDEATEALGIFTVGFRVAIGVVDDGKMNQEI